MPASDATYYNLRRLHWAFAAASLGLLGVTIWLLAADHARPWKRRQRAFRAIQQRMAELRRRQLEAAADAERLKELERAAAAARRIPPSEPVVARLAGLLRKPPGEGRGDTALAAAIERAARQWRELARRTPRDDPAIEAARTRWLELADEAVRRASRREEGAARREEMAKAERQRAQGEYDVAVREGRSAERLAQLLERVDAAQRAVEEAAARRSALTLHRRRLEQARDACTAAERAAQAALEEQRRAMDALEQAYRRRRSTYVVWRGWLPLPGKKWLELPLLDAFNSPLRIATWWSDRLQRDLHFRRVPRIDRCTTCHQAIAQTAPGSPDRPAYPPERRLTFVLPPPEASEQDAGPGRLLGVELAGEDLLGRPAAVVAAVHPGSPADRAAPDLGPDRPLPGGELRRRWLHDALDWGGSSDSPPPRPDEPGLACGDVLEAINGRRPDSAEDAARLLVQAARGGEPVTVVVRRGLPQPYASHPRLDLMVGPLSPHPAERFGCTVCHGGQGSATDFRWAAHSPNDPDQGRRWREQLGWREAADWPEPMLPRRFAQSACLRCHHDAGQLDASDRFAEPPAERLVEAERLVRRWGCFGCHEINGYDGEGRRVGPDLRLEPNIAGAARRLARDPGFARLSADEQAQARRLAENPQDEQARRAVLRLLEAERAAPQPRLAPETIRLAPVFGDHDHPGSLRRVGPSLRRVANKLDPETLLRWIRDPTTLRPATRMPRFFGLWDHLDERSRRVARRFEAVEVRAIAAYLLAASEPPAADGEGGPAGREGGPEREGGAGPAAGVARGRRLFATQGCLACHDHRAYPDAARLRPASEPAPGPDLSDLPAKLAPERNPNARAWLRAWIQDPSRYDPRTLMPACLLKPPEDEASSAADPLEDLIAFLLAGAPAAPDAERPAQASRDAPPTLDETALDELTRLYLIDAGGGERWVADALGQANGALLLADVQPAERELLASNGPPTAEQKLRYVGRKTIARLGCFGCHDIPGFENARPVGVVLSDWGRKDPAQLAFEHVVQYVERQGGAASGRADGRLEQSGGAGRGRGRASAPLPPFYLDQLRRGGRAGFAYQKLTEPRSFDYRKTPLKQYTDWLRMPQFPLTPPQREAIVAFLLGLTADPPSEACVDRPEGRRAALLAGSRLLEQRHCLTCHLVAPEQWTIAHEPDVFGPQARSPSFPVAVRGPSPDELDASAAVDRRGLRWAVLRGMPVLSNDGAPLLLDDLGAPVEQFPDELYRPRELEIPFQLWAPAAVDGHGYLPGEAPLAVRGDMIRARRPARGGFLTKYLLPLVTAQERQRNPSAKGTEAWGWLPPPLMGEGAKVQPQWLYEFLLDPAAPIRPAAVMRMPRFSLSPAEAAALTDYFAAVEGRTAPPPASRRRRPERLQAKDAAYAQRVRRAEGLAEAPRGRRLHDALRIVVDRNYCVRCHIVADFDPATSQRAKAPNLADVHRRLQADYVLRWIAKPAAILPYTAMPVNIPYDPADADQLGGVSQELYRGTSVEQLDALVDLLMNFDRFAEQRAPVAPLVGPADAANGAGGP